MRKLLLFAALPLLSSCTTQKGQAPAGAAAGEAPDCFFASQVSGFKDGGPTLCAGARGGGRICEGRPAELVVPRPSGSGGQRCLVNNIRKLSAEEMATAWGRQPAD